MRLDDTILDIPMFLEDGTINPEWQQARDKQYENIAKELEEANGKGTSIEEN